MKFRNVFVAALALGFVSATPARAGIPGIGNWVTPSLIRVTGHDGAGVRDPIGEFLIVARDLANQPMPSVVVQLDFSQCTELRLCADPHDPAAVVDCAQSRVTKVTDPNGEVRFRVIGYSVGVPGTPGSGTNAARIIGDGFLIAFPSVAIYDLTGGDGLTPADLSAWLADFFSGTPPERGDYDGDLSIGPGDLSRWLDAHFASGSIANCSPGGGCP